MPPRALYRARALGSPEPQLDLLQAMIDAKLGRHGGGRARLAAGLRGMRRDQTRSSTRRWPESIWRRSTSSALPPSSTASPARRPRTLGLTSGGRKSIAGRESAPDAVLNDYREALKCDPALARARLGLADELRKAHRNVEAAAEYDRYLALKPDDPAGSSGGWSEPLGDG